MFGVTSGSLNVDTKGCEMYAQVFMRIWRKSNVSALHSEATRNMFIAEQVGLTVVEENTCPGKPWGISFKGC